MKQKEYSPQYLLPAKPCVMEVASGLFVVTIIDKLTCVQIQLVWPVLVFPSSVEDDEFFIFPVPETRKPPLLAVPNNFEIASPDNWVPEAS